MHQLEMAITSPGVPADVVNMLLNLAEFMEHDEKALAIEPRLLGTYVSQLLRILLILRLPPSMPTPSHSTTRRWSSSMTHHHRW